MSTAEEKRWYSAVAMMENCALCGSFGVQIAHMNQFKSMGKKNPYWQVAPLCPECHHEIDNGRDMAREERRSLMLLAVFRTYDWLMRNGLLILKR
jgi:hypothetical protein